MSKRILSLALVVLMIFSSIGITSVFAEEAADNQDSVVITDSIGDEEVNTDSAEPPEDDGNPSEETSEPPQAEPKEDVPLAKTCYRPGNRAGGTADIQVGSAGS